MLKAADYKVGDKVRWTFERMGGVVISIEELMRRSPHLTAIPERYVAISVDGKVRVVREGDLEKVE